jgi:hypothetical protein
MNIVSPSCLFWNQVAQFTNQTLGFDCQDVHIGSLVLIVFLLGVACKIGVTIMWNM